MSSGAPNVAHLHSGATGRPALPDAVGAELRRQQRHRTWDDSTLLARDAAQAYREVCGPRVEAQEHERSPGNTHLS